MRNTSKTIRFFLILLVITIVLISTVGLKLLLNSSVFVANLFSKKEVDPLSKTADVYGSLNIDNIPVATNTPNFIIEGSVVNYEKIQFYINSKKVKEIETIAKDNFSEEIGELVDGENQIYLKALTKDGKNTKKTNLYTVILKTSKPKLEILEPQDKATLTSQEITIKGATDKEVFVKINDLPIVVDINGNFQSAIKLNEGENIIKIIAEDIANNLEEKTLTVSYQKE